MISPQFETIKSIYGKPISNSLRALYENKIELQKSLINKVIEGKPFNEWIHIDFYCPLDKKHIDGQWVQDGIHFAFAGDGSGSEYVVDPTDDQGIIFFFVHETGELIPTGVTMEQYSSLKDKEGDT